MPRIPSVATALRVLLSTQYSRFLLTGGVAALVNIIARFLLSYAIAFEAAVVGAHLIGMLVAYSLMRSFVFKASGRSIAAELYRFALVNLVTLAVIWCVSVGLARIVFPSIGFTWHTEDLAHVIGVLAPAVTSYWGHRYFSFRTGT